MTCTDLELYEPGEEDEPEDAMPTPEELGARIAEATADLTRLTREAAELSAEPDESEPGTALVPSNATAATAKKRLASLRAGATRQQAAIRAKTEEIRERQKEIESLMHEQMALAEEALAPLQKFVARLEEGIWMVNLYLGRDEEILLLRDGDPAPANEPLVIRQMVLAMDEECAVNPDDDGIDSTNIGEFDAWLQADPAHVDQVLPDLKGVVALRPRFHSKEYADPWKAAAVEELDRQTYFLIRNGDKLYRTWMEFNAGKRLVPAADEFASFFFEEHRSYTGRKRDQVRTPIAPGTLAWERAEEAADARQRHYMRVALILQGLVDRTTVFHPLPDQGISFTDPEHVGKTWKFIMDEEGTLTTGRKPFREWLDEKCAELRVGMRVVGSFTRTYSARDEKWEYRIWPRGAERPPSSELLALEEKTKDGGFIVRYKRSEEIYDPKMWVANPDRPGWGHYGGYKKPKQRASCLLDPDDRNLIPFDLVTVEEMEEYLRARTERHNYADMFPLLKAAIRAKHAERAEEEPFRTMLVGVLARDNRVSAEVAEDDVDAMIEWWKLTNKNHRPLVGDEQSQAKAVRMIVAEHARRVKARRKGYAPNVVSTLREKHPDAILIGRRRDGTYVVVTPENSANVFVHRWNYGAKGGPRDGEEWKLLTKAWIARLTVVYEAERLADWDFNATLRDHLTGPEFEAMTEEVLRDTESLVAAAYHPEKQRFYLWRLESNAVLNEAHPITGDHTEVKVDERQRKWARKGREAVLQRPAYSNRSRYSYQRKPWDTRPVGKLEPGWWDDKPVSKEEMADNRYVVVYYDSALDAHVEAEKERFDAFRERQREMIERTNELRRRIEAAWIRRKEALEYQRFLENFLDPELWEGHRKTLPRDTFAYPYSHRGDRFDKLLDHLVENDIDPTGMSVREALGVAQDGKHLADPHASAIPEDILDLRFDSKEDS